jgi:hypothetical protein
VKGILIFVFFLGTIWDFFTSFFGIVSLFKVQKLEPQYAVVFITAAIIGLIMSGLSLYSEKIWEEDADDFHKYALRPLHVVSITYDAYTSFVGTAKYLVLRDYNSFLLNINFAIAWDNTNVEEKITLLIITAIVTVSPVLLAKLWKK